MPYSVIVCKDCDMLTSDAPHGPEDEHCEAPSGFERVELYTEREVRERVDEAVKLVHRRGVSTNSSWERVPCELLSPGQEACAIPPTDGGVVGKVDRNSGGWTIVIYKRGAQGYEHGTELLYRKATS